MSYVCGIDVGGTFTDCVVVGDDGSVTVAKSPSTPGDFSRGMFDVMAVAAGELGLETSDFLGQVSALFHGTTVATNAMVERKGVDSGMLTTRGHRDVLSIMRGAGRTAGLSPEEYLQVSVADKPSPIVPRRLIGEIDERVDAKGQVVVDLDEDGAREVIRRLVGTGVRSIGVCLLWSFQNPAHEQRLKEIIAEEAPEGTYVTLSHELIPKWGEYERAAGTAINGYIGPLVRDYLDDLRNRGTEAGMHGRILIMQASGGLAEASRVVDVALQTIGSGPVAGVTGSSRFGQETGAPNVICTDMGGTTFDVGLIVDNQPIRRPSSIVSQYEYVLPQVDVRSVGSGGGSIAWIDPISKALRVGPQSAGASPGPAAYGQGGTEPTVTDADLVLGFIDPERFLGGRMSLDRSAAEAALTKVADELDLGHVELAAGIVQIVEAQMAELIRQMTVQSGYDPRDFVVYAYGGAGATHGVGYAAELGARAVVVPLLNLGAVWSAFGVAASDLVELVESTDIMRQPFQLDRLNSLLADLEQTARTRLVDQGVGDADITVVRRAFLRYTAQIHEVDVVIPDGDVDEAAAAALVEQFEERYEQLFGKGSGFAGAGIELVTVSVEGRGHLEAQRHVASHVAAHARGQGSGIKELPSRAVHWPREGESLTTRIFDGTSLSPGDQLDGPAIIELPHTTIVVPPRYSAAIDEFGDCVIEL
jgi:N-methylhydantoinase A